MSDPTNVSSSAVANLGKSNFPSETMRTTVSLLLFIHCFCLLVVLSSCFSSSRLQSRLVALFSPYTRGLYLDPNYLPPDRRLAAMPPLAFYLTTGEGDTRLHQWLVTSADGTTYRFPQRSYPWGYRWDRQARIGGYFASHLESDEVPAEMAKALCRHLQAQLPSGELSWPLYVRIIRHLGSDDPEVFDDLTGNVEVLYEADVWRAEGDAPASFHVLKRVPNSQSAPPIRRESKS